MKAVCPECGLVAEMPAFLVDPEARLVVEQALRIAPQLSRLILQYMGLFRPPRRALSLRKSARLLQQLADVMQAGQVERRGRAWPAPLPHWEAALQQMLDGRARLQLPLKNNNYLFEIVAGLADKTEAQQEQAVEQRRQARAPAATQGLTHIGDRLSQLAGIENLIKNAPDGPARESLERQAARLRQETTD